MASIDWTRWRIAFQDLFQERHVYVRSGGEVRGLVLTTSRQVMLSGMLGLLALWMTMGTASIFATLASGDLAQQMAQGAHARYQAVTDARARLGEAAVADLGAVHASFAQLVASTEKRHEALTMLLSQVRAEPGLASAVAPEPVADFTGRSPLAAMQAVRADQDRLIDATETYAKSRGERLRMALRMAGLGAPSPARLAGEAAVGGPLIAAKDPRALAAELDVDPAFAARIQHAADDLARTTALDAIAEQLPLARPTDNTQETSGFGVRVDPFTGLPAFHPGQDFAGPMATPIHATASGVVSFTGVRTGYGNTIEIDHGQGFKTRYAHLSAINVAQGQKVVLGERIGAMGSTGRSTGPHLHYEVWKDGRVLDPKRFLEAGEYVQQAG